MQKKNLIRAIIVEIELSVIVMQISEANLLPNHLLPYTSHAIPSEPKVQCDFSVVNYN